jgi:predicted nuclease of predicted toxin-antitoxin system
MRFLVDNSLSPRLALALSKAAHDAVHVRDRDLSQADDGTIFDAAAREQRVILAQDTDFGTILALREAPSPSVVLFRCQAKSTEALITLLLANLPAMQADLEAGAVVVIEDARIRVRRLPISGGQPEPHSR